MDCEWEPGESFVSYLVFTVTTMSMIALIGYYISSCVGENNCVDSDRIPDDYCYDGPGGVEDWSERYPASISCRQSPVNLNIIGRLAASTDLCCSGFNETPIRLQLHNEGHTVWLLGRWCNGMGPRVTGGPLNCRYKFHSVCFRWGPGAEHCINDSRAVLEVQAMFLREDMLDLTDASAQGRKDSLVIISYMYEFTPRSNPFLEHIICGLDQIVCPQTYCDLELRPLCWLAPAFAREYFCYRGSLTFPPCSEVVVWILQPEPLGISVEQLEHFRKLRNNCGAQMITNCRPLQELNERDVFFYN